MRQVLPIRVLMPQRRSAIRPYSALPGHEVLLTSRCPKNLGRLLTVPRGHRVPSTPTVHEACWFASVWKVAPSFHAATSMMAACAAELAWELWWLPITEMPKVPVLKPSACAPTMLRCSPPLRPS